MYCPKCGTKNKDDSKFCTNCAQELIVNEFNTVEKISSKKIYSAHLINIISAVVLIISIILIAYGVSTATGSVNSETTQNGLTHSTTNATVTFDTSGAPIAYISCAFDAIVVILGLIIYFAKSVSAKRRLAYIYMIFAFLITVLFFFAGIRTISFTCGLGFVLTVSGILQIVAGSKFLSALKNDW